jgi:hypothetical protein
MPLRILRLARHVKCEERSAFLLSVLIATSIVLEGWELERAPYGADVADLVDPGYRMEPLCRWVIGISLSQGLRIVEKGVSSSRRSTIRSLLWSQLHMDCNAPFLPSRRNGKGDR